MQLLILKYGLKAPSATPTKSAGSQEGQENKDMPDTRDSDLVEEGGQFDELRDFMQGMQKECAVLHAACAAEKTARAKILLEMSTLWDEKAAQMKRIEEFTRRVAEKLSVRKRSVAEKGRKEDVVEVKKLNEQVKQFSACVTALEGKEIKCKEPVADHTVTLKAA